MIFPLIVLYFSNVEFKYKILNRIILCFDKYVLYTFVWHAVYLLIYKYFQLPISGIMMIISTICCWGIGILYYHTIGRVVNNFITKRVILYLNEE